MEQLWPLPGPDVADVIRAVCQRLVEDAEGLTDELTGPALTAQNDPALISDASLAAEDRHLNHSDLVQWLSSNIQQPGRRVDPYFSARTTAYIRDLASRGLTPDFAGGWRAALAVAWRRWVTECLEVCTEPAVLVDVLDITAQSMTQYAIDWVVAAREASVADAMSNADVGAIAMIQMIASGAEISQDLAENRLNYRLARQHQALVLWADDPVHADALEDLVAAVRSSTEARSSALVARASSTSRWIWLSGSAAPDQHPVQKLLAESELVQSALGRVGQGLEGFRSSHQDALAAQAMVIRLGSTRPFTAYADVELIDTLTKDRASARRFVTKTLGPLAEADPALRETLLTYVQSGFNTTRAAASLYAHRNTVERRVSRANELSTVKVEDNPTHVAAALMVLEVAPDIAADPAHPAH